MATDWVVYAEQVDGTSTEPRGKLHCLDADKNEFPCGTVVATTHDWPVEVALSALASHPSEVSVCSECNQASGLLGP
jgi:hypothetical protein